MYMPDLTVAQAPFYHDILPVKCVGWLDEAHPYPTGVVSEEILQRIYALCDNCYIYTLGIHECPFCPSPLQVRIEGFGSGEAYVFGSSAIYHIPDMLYHYITVHTYVPPQEFLEAVMESPLFNTLAYTDKINTHMKTKTGIDYWLADWDDPNLQVRIESRDQHTLHIIVDNRPDLIELMLVLKVNEDVQGFRMDMKNDRWEVTIPYIEGGGFIFEGATQDHGMMMHSNKGGYYMLP